MWKVAWRWPALAIMRRVFEGETTSDLSRSHTPVKSLCLEVTHRPLPSSKLSKTAMR